MTDEKQIPFQEKLLKVMEGIQYLQKTGENQTQNYNYIKDSTVKEAFRKIFLDNKLLFKCTVFDVKAQDFDLRTKKGTKQILTTLTMECTISNAEGEGNVHFNSGGQGIDPGDKGIFKAMTGALKHGLMNMFLIPTGDDPEVPNEADKADAAGQEELKIKVQNALNKTLTEEDITKVMVRAEKVLSKENLENINHFADVRFEEIRGAMQNV